MLSSRSYSLSAISGPLNALIVAGRVETSAPVCLIFYSSDAGAHSGRRLLNVVLISAQRQKRWANVETMFATSPVSPLGQHSKWTTPECLHIHQDLRFQHRPLDLRPVQG